MTADEEVAVLGAGRMGSSVAASCALAGLRVTTMSRHPDRARAAVGLILAGAVRHQLVDSAGADRAAGRVRHVDSAAGISADVTLVLENLPESLSLKVEVVRGVLARLGRDAIVATNTSSLSISALGRGIGAEEGTAGLHFMNPALLMPLVELIPGDASAAGTLSRCERVAKQLGKQIIWVNADVPGFVWNRLQIAMLREAVQLVSDGIASAGDVDAAVALGLARRWQYAGPLTTASLGGAATFATVARNLLPVCSARRDLDDLDDYLPAGAAAAAASAAREEGLARLLRGDRPGTDRAEGG